MKSFKAPWGRTLVVVSALATAFCLGFPIFLAYQSMAPAWIGLLLPLIAAGCAPFAIRGYALTPDALLIRRLFWTTRIPLEGLTSARFEPDAMRRSLRLCGNGGFFSFTGWYRSKALGIYRAWVTDLHPTVVLRFANRTIVLSPENPEGFVRELSPPRPGT